MNIQNNVVNQDLAIVKPLYDTWRIKKSVGYWGLDGQLKLQSFSVQEINAWFAESLIKTLDSFSSLSRISKLTLLEDSESGVDTGGILKLESNISYKKYIQNSLKSVREHAIPIYEIRIELDMFVFVRTESSPVKPIRSWVKELGDIHINIDREDENAGLWLNIENTLFYPFSYKGSQDNTELFRLNKPLLEEALKNWEQKFDSPIDVEGLPGIYKYGFLPEDQW